MIPLFIAYRLSIFAYQGTVRTHTCTGLYPRVRMRVECRLLRTTAIARGPRSAPRSAVVLGWRPSSYRGRSVAALLRVHIHAATVLVPDSTRGLRGGRV